MVKDYISKCIQTVRASKLTSYGDKVRIMRGASFVGDIEVGSNVYIGERANFVSALAKIKIHDYVIFGPDVAIYTGDHAVDIVGKHICEVTNQDKHESGREYDKDVVIEAGCWIGTRAIILKGVTIGRGSVIGAGAIVTRDIPPYSIFVGNGTSGQIRKRFTNEQIAEHECLLKIRGVTIV